MSEKKRTVKRKIDKLKGLGLEVKAVSNYVYEATNDKNQRFCIGLSQLETWSVTDLYDTITNYWNGCKGNKH